MPQRAEVVYLRPALEDMEEIVKFHINEVGPASARKIYADMRHKLGRLADFPLMGQTHPDSVLAQSGYRKLVLTRTYVAVYRIIDGVVTIYRVVNGRTAAAGSCDRAGGTGRTEFGGCQSCHSKTEKETGIFAKGNQGGKDHCADSAGH